MIPKAHKLHAKDIYYISKKGFKKKIEFGTISIIKQYPNKSYHQIGIAISTKVHKSAVIRNMIRRVLYTLLYDTIDSCIHIRHQSCVHIKCFVLIDKHNLGLKQILQQHPGGVDYKTIYTYFQTILLHPSFHHTLLSCLIHHGILNFE